MKYLKNLTVKTLLSCIIYVGGVFLNSQGSQAQTAPRFNMGITSTPAGAEVKLTLVHRYQRYNARPSHQNDVYDKSINSPKSVNFTPDGKKFYIHSLEGLTTSVYDASTMQQLKVIEHVFKDADSLLFKDNEITVFDYKYRTPRKNHNDFSGKPVESCLSHDGRYLWVTYYRRDYDMNAEAPSAVAIIDTHHDSIVRVMPTGPLPKMIACSPDNKYIAISHWGDNTVGIIDISGSSVFDFHYVAHCIVDYRATLNFGSAPVNRDQQCGHCLRGTVFSPNGNYLFVGKMGGSGGIAVFDMASYEYLGTVRGQKNNLRHMIIHDGQMIVSTNSSGFVQRASVQDIVDSKLTELGKTTTFSDWKNAYVGKGVRTIDITSDGAYIFACVNNETKISVIRASDMKVISSIRADAYPVGMALSPDNTRLIVTSQGKSSTGGNSVMVYEVSYFQ
jgi:DNA-binding beta-propeller fold protein YncE